MKPTLDDFLSSAARWDGSYRGIQYELSWHGCSDCMPEGTWCWYIIVTQEQFYPDDWERLRLAKEDRVFAGSARRHWAYENFPDLEPHGGWTFGEMTSFLGRDGKEHERVKVGCDYAHSWDRDSGYWEKKSDIDQDVRKSIDLLCEMFPNRRLRCHYCGKFGEPGEFYTDGFGEPVHTSHIDQLRQDGWEKWLPATAEG